jgi:hypothetical protein
VTASSVFFFHYFRPDLPGPERMAAFYALATYWQLVYWKDLETEMRRQHALPPPNSSDETFDL